MIWADEGKKIKERTEISKFIVAAVSGSRTRAAITKPPICCAKKESATKLKVNREFSVQPYAKYH